MRSQVLHLRSSSAPSIIVNVVNMLVYAMEAIISVITMEIQTDLPNNVKINNESGTWWNKQTEQIAVKDFYFHFHCFFANPL